jgi:RNA polymerase-binding protein DksA
MPSATSQDPIQFPEERERKVITYLSTKELREFKALLLAKREELAGDVKLLTSEALNRTERGSGEQSSMPIHMADLGTDAWEQDFTLGLIASEKALVREIDEALERIADKTYGICVATDKPIPRERLHAKPWAKYCIEYARLREEGRAP